MTDWLKTSLIKLLLIISEPLDSEEENISDATDNLVKNHISEMNSKQNSEDLLSSLFEWAAEVSKTDSECLIIKRAWTEDKTQYESVSLQVCSLKYDVLYCKD